MDYSVDFSIIIITRNEEKRIKECLDSALSGADLTKAKGIIGEYEVILVDSASTDRTIDIAKQYPITILQLESSWPLSSSAGIYIGVLNARGKYLAKVDGDTILDKEWFSNAIPVLSDVSIGGVTGIYVEEMEENTFVGRELTKESLNQPVGEVEVISTGIYQAATVKEVANFQPYLKAGEDRLISYLLRKKGYKLLRLPFKEISHFYSDTDKVTYFQYLKTMNWYSVGDGQAARYILKDREIFFKYLFRYITIYFSKIYIIILLAINLIITNWLVFSQQEYSKYQLIISIIDILLIFFSTFIIIVRYKNNKLNKSLYASFNAIPYMIARQLGFFLGFIKNVKDSSQYPTNVKVIKKINSKSKNQKIIQKML